MTMTIEQIENQLNSLKEAARNYCREINLDGAIRTLCRGVGSEGDSTNRYIKIPLPNGKILDLRATWGAGCNGAYAQYADSSLADGFHLYQCTEYGGHLSRFQDGPWVQVVLELAVTEAELQQAAATRAKMQGLQEELRKWMPVEA